MNRRSFTIVSLGLLALIVYLFMSAPPPLPEARQAQGPEIPIETVFQIVEHENDVLRALWTKEIVGAGKKAGLKFDEDWREMGIDAGPLPALFLRETAASLEKNPVRLGLYLGSDFPIRRANRFEVVQLSTFERIRETGEPAFFWQEDTGLHTRMFPDRRRRGLRCLPQRARRKPEAGLAPARRHGGDDMDISRGERRDARAPDDHRRTPQGLSRCL